MAELRQPLADGMHSLGLSATSNDLGALLNFLALLTRWGKVYNLTAVHGARDLMTVHLLDSLSILPLVDRLAPATLLDVGSGAGLPSIPLAILRPALPITSVDAVAKKIGFQLQAKAALGLGQFMPFHARIEALEVDRVPSLIVSRAYAPLAAMVRSVEHIAGRTTTLLAMKGVTPIDEIATLQPSWIVDEIVPLDVPFLGAARCAILLRRVAS